MNVIISKNVNIYAEMVDTVCMNIYEYKDFRSYVKDWVAAQPKKGRGVWRALAESLRISPVTLSQIFNGKRTLSEDYALMLVQQLNLLELEKEYFLLLVQLDRAGTANLKKYCEKKLAAIRHEALEVKHQLAEARVLDDEAKAMFYSNWFFSAIRLACSIPQVGSIDSLARLLGLPRTQVEEAVKFLLNVGLCVNKNGMLEMGPARTHVPRESLLNTRHQTNWRLQGLQALTQNNDEALFFTSPMALSKKAYEQIRKALVNNIKSLNEVAVASDSEIVACLNIDLFQVSKD